jgi:hypothetical protein
MLFSGIVLPPDDLFNLITLLCGPARNRSMMVPRERLIKRLETWVPPAIGRHPFSSRLLANESRAR